MAYNKHKWKARTGVGLNKFKDADGRVYEFTPAPDEVTEPGTPFSAEWMNEIEAGIAAAGIIYAVCDTAAGTAAKVVNTGGAPEQLANGDNFRILFVNEVQEGATLNVNGLGAYPIIDNYTGEAIVLGDIGAGYVSDIIFENGQYMLLNAYRAAAAPSGHQLFTESGTFTVPARVTSIRVSACAAGVGEYAGAGIENVIYNVTPGQKIELTIGTGNTKIGDFETLIAGTLASSKPSTKLGYATGYSGGKGYAAGGYGGYYGYGGGGCGSAFSTSARGGGGGAGEGAAGGSVSTGSNTGAQGGGGTGGTGGSSSEESSGGSAGGNATVGTLLYDGGPASGGGLKGGSGSIYGAGGGGGANYTGSSQHGGGGGAGGYGAGGGDSVRSNAKGTPSNGMVLIEWGFTL